MRLARCAGVGLLAALFFVPLASLMEALHSLMAQ